jgi:hypothetical protein
MTESISLFSVLRTLQLLYRRVGDADVKDLVLMQGEHGLELMVVLERDAAGGGKERILSADFLND